MNQREQSLAVRSHLRAQELQRRQSQRCGISLGAALHSSRVANVRESIRAGMYDDDEMLEKALDRMMAHD